jgi:hypothetical protein
MMMKMMQEDEITMSEGKWYFKHVVMMSCLNKG